MTWEKNDVLLYLNLNDSDSISKRKEWKVKFDAWDSGPCENGGGAHTYVIHSISLT